MGAMSIATWALGARIRTLVVAPWLWSYALAMGLTAAAFMLSHTDVEVGIDDDGFRVIAIAMSVCLVVAAMVFLPLAYRRNHDPGLHQH
jgi:hypothetical protein